VLRRYPKGIGAEPFFQKDVAHEVPDAVWKLPVWSESREAAMQYVVVENVEALVWLVQMDCIEIHPWLSRVGDCATCCGADAEGLEGPACGLDHPDVLAFDIDPYVREGRLGHRPTEAGGEPGVSDEDFRKALEVAALLRHNLDDLGLRSWPKTSGKRGLHIYIPLEPNHNYTQVRAFAKTLAAFFVREHPDLATIEYAKEARAGRVFLDYNQNVRGKTLAAPLSLRPTPEATVSMPLSWKDIPSANPLDFTLETVPGALGSKKDPWADFAPQRIEAAIRRGSPETESRLH
jgi:bifunctional non-homologous end joining protein LigD